MSANNPTFERGYQLLQDAGCLSPCKQKTSVSNLMRFLILSQANLVNRSLWLVSSYGNLTIVLNLDCYILEF